VKNGYNWMLQSTEKVKWDKMDWARLSIPRHSFIMWIFMHHRMPTKMRLNKFQPRENLKCNFCNNKDEDEYHLFFDCPTARAIWTEIRGWWPIPPIQPTIEETTKTLLKTKGNPSFKQINYAIFSAVIYAIWTARNAAIFKAQHTIVQEISKAIKRHIIQRVLHMQTFTKKFDAYIDNYSDDSCM